MIQEIECVVVPRDLNVGAGVPVHSLASLLLLVRVSVSRSAHRMQKVHCDLLGENDCVRVWRKINDVLPSLVVLALVVKSVDNESKPFNGCDIVVIIVLFVISYY